METIERNLSIIQILKKYENHPLIEYELKYQRQRMKNEMKSENMEFETESIIGESYIDFIREKKAPLMILKIHFVLLFLMYFSFNLKK